jgi:hypothetical protein
MATYEEIMGEAEATIKPVKAPPRKNTAAVSLEEMTGEDYETEADAADKGFFRHALDVVVQGNEAMKEDLKNSPLSMTTPTAGLRPIVGGMLAMGRQAVSGLIGLTAMARGKDFGSGQQAVDKFVEADRKFSEGIFYVNMAPKSKTEEAMNNLLMLIPEGITALGDTVFEKTGSALAGAGTQAMATLLTLKPSVASKAFRGIKKLAGGEKQTPAGKMGAQQVKSAFEELAKTDPEAATTLKEHVAKADPELEKLLGEALESAKGKTPEQIGADSAKARFKQVGTTAEGKPRVRAVEEPKPNKAEELPFEAKPVDGKWQLFNRRNQKYVGKAYETKEAAQLAADSRNTTLAKARDQLAQKAGETTTPRTTELTIDDAGTAISQAVGDGYNTLKGATPKPMVAKANEAAARARVKESIKDFEYVSDETGAHIVKAPGGELRAQESGKFLQIKRQDVEAKVQGKGISQAMIERLAPEAERAGLTLSSDVTVSAAAQRVYEALKRKGWNVKENPNTLNKETGSKVSLDPRVPVYELRRPGVKPSIPATPDPVVFMDAGHPVTRSMLSGAFESVGKAFDNTPGLGILKGKLTEYYSQILRTFNPEGLSQHAKTTAAVVAKSIAQQMQRDSAFYHQALKRRAFWDRRITEAPEFIRKMESGEKFNDPVLNEAAQAYRAWNERIAKQEATSGIKYESVDNYLYQLFDNGDAVASYFERKYGSKWNDPKFIKDKNLKLYDEAVKAGFKPKFHNPEDIMLARQHAADIATMRVGILEELATTGLAQKVGKSGQRPEGFPSNQWRSPNGESYWVHDSANAILHNAFNTKSLWTMQGIAGDAFRGAMFLKNTIVPIKLALSLFHPLHVATIDNATGMVRASKELLSGKMSPAKYVKEMVRAAAYVDLAKETGGQLASAVGFKPTGGNRLLKVYQGLIPEAKLTPVDKQALTFMAEGGFIPEMSSQYRTNAISNFTAAVRRRSLKAAWHLPFAAIMSIQKPMFEIWIPSLKIASYLRDVQTAIKTDPTLLNNPVKRQVAFRRLAKSVDNRYGEMAYNTLFWNRWVKDLAVANTLSLGWQMGFIREYGGGMMDLGHTVTKQGSVIQKAKTGMLDRPLFVTYYTVQSLAYGGLLTWALSGEEPKELLDYTFPKNGEINPDESPQRMNTMFYPREFIAIYKHMENEGVLPGLGHLAANKASGVLGMTTMWATGVNGFGQEIRDPDAPALRKVEQTLRNTLFELEPISVGAIREQVTENPLKSSALAVAGFNPAPKYVTATKTESRIRGTFRKYFSATQTPYDKAMFSESRRELQRAFDNGDQERFSIVLDKMYEEFQLTPRELRKLENSVVNREEPLLNMFQRLTWQQQKKILDGMTEEEREVYLPMANKEHLRYSYEPPEESN